MKPTLAGLPLGALLLAFGASAVSAESAGSPPRPNEQMKVVLDKLAGLGPKPLPTLSAEEARRQPSPADAVKAVLADEGKTPPMPPLAKADDRKVNAGGRAIPVRVYTPKGDGPFPVVVYFHGGGWVIATIDTYDASARGIASQAGAVVVSVEYRKGPENKFPAAHDDAFAVYKWVAENARELNGDPSRIAVAGESAGGNLAAAVAMMARDRGVAMPVHQLLVYPIAGYDFETASYRENATAKPLDKASMQWFFQQYLKSPADGRDPRISLASAHNLAGLPPATIITAQIDPLRSEGKALADALKAAGVSVDFRNFDGVTHEFFGMAAVLDEAKRAQAFAVEGLKRSLAKTKTRQARPSPPRSR